MTTPEDALTVEGRGWAYGGGHWETCAKWWQPCPPPTTESEDEDWSITGYRMPKPVAAPTVSGGGEEADIKADISTKPSPPVAYTTHEMLELCYSLVSTQIREERINSFEELYHFKRHIADVIEADKKSDRAPLAASPGERLIAAAKECVAGNVSRREALNSEPSGRPLEYNHLGSFQMALSHSQPTSDDDHYVEPCSCGLWNCRICRPPQPTSDGGEEAKWWQRSERKGKRFPDSWTHGNVLALASAILFLTMLLLPACELTRQADANQGPVMAQYIPNSATSGQPYAENSKETPPLFVYPLSPARAPVILPQKKPGDL